MIKRLLASGLLLSFIVLGFAANGVDTQAQDEPCIIPENYNEAAGENQVNMLRLFTFVGNDGVWDTNPDSISLYYSMLQSVRQYYERQHDILPNCAHDLNFAYIRTTTAMQDVLALNWAIQANPDDTTLITRANRAKTYLNNAWADLSAIQRATTFEF